MTLTAIVPLVPVPFQVERIAFTRNNNTPYLLYKTAKGRCCTFLKKTGFFKALGTLLGLKKLSLGELVTVAVQGDDLIAKGAEGSVVVGIAELRHFLPRYNRAGLENLRVDFCPGQKVAVRSETDTHYLTPKGGCDCEDYRFRRSICKHRIAGQVAIAQIGWANIEDYLKLQRAASWEEEVAEARASLGI